MLTLIHSIRYASPPVGQLRWQPPTPPAKNTSQVIQAVAQPPLCPQSGAAGTPAVYGFISGPGDEDCLFLNVYAPPGASDLPVFVWIRKLLPRRRCRRLIMTDRWWRLWAVRRSV
jgi:carboxylesterase type B